MKGNKHKEMKLIGTVLLLPMLLILVKPLYSFANVVGVAAGFEGPVGFTQPLEGFWQYHDSQWTYQTSEGTVKNRWACIASGSTGIREWYCFDADGHLLTGWQKGSGGNWYYLRRTEDSRYGAMEKGLILEPEDGKYYYLDPETGVMRTGWVRIDGKYRYFSETGDPNTWIWNRNQKRWMYSPGSGRSAGSMYVNEMTPDGYYTDAQGVRIEKQGF